MCIYTSLLLIFFKIYIYIDTIEEVKTTCQFCNKKAVLNLKHVDGHGDMNGPVVQLGAEEKYFPTCFVCYRNSLIESGQCPSLWQEESAPAPAAATVAEVPVPEDRSTPVVH